MFKALALNMCAGCAIRADATGYPGGKDVFSQNYPMSNGLQRGMNGGGTLC